MTAWQAARSHPHTYPGAHPAGAFALIDDTVQDLVQDGADLGSLRPADPAPAPGGPGGPGPGGPRDGGPRPLDALLAERGLAALADRIPVLAYGGNRSPATLALKLEHYGYVPAGRGVVLPVLPARLRGFDAVASGLSGQGYLYADLYADELTAGTEIAVHVMLLDPEQLRVMHDSEGVRTDLYDVASVPGLTLDGGSPEFSALAYLGVGPILRSPKSSSPLAFSAVRASGRRFPGFDAVAMLAHALAAVDLLAEVRSVVGAGLDPGTRERELADPLLLAAELMRYLNGQWWYRQHTGERRVLACERLEALIASRLRTISTINPVRDRLAGQGRILTAEQAYRADPRLAIGAALGHHPG